MLIKQPQQLMLENNYQLPVNIPNEQIFVDYEMIKCCSCNSQVIVESNCHCRENMQNTNTKLFFNQNNNKITNNIKNCGCCCCSYPTRTKMLQQQQRRLQKSPNEDSNLYEQEVYCSCPTTYNSAANNNDDKNNSKTRLNCADSVIRWSRSSKTRTKTKMLTKHVVDNHHRSSRSFFNNGGIFKSILVVMFLFTLSLSSVNASLGKSLNRTVANDVTTEYANSTRKGKIFFFFLSAQIQITRSSSFIIFKI